MVGKTENGHWDVPKIVISPPNAIFPASTSPRSPRSPRSVTSSESFSSFDSLVPGRIRISLHRRTRSSQSGSDSTMTSSDSPRSTTSFSPTTSPTTSPPSKHSSYFAKDGSSVRCTVSYRRQCALIRSIRADEATYAFKQMMTEIKEDWKRLKIERIAFVLPPQLNFDELLGLLRYYIDMQSCALQQHPAPPQPPKNYLLLCDLKFINAVADSIVELGIRFKDDEDFSTTF